MTLFFFFHFSYVRYQNDKVNRPKDVLYFLENKTYDIVILVARTNKCFRLIYFSF